MLMFVTILGINKQKQSNLGKKKHKLKKWQQRQRRINMTMHPQIQAVYVNAY
jgi:hypothetical protein